MRYSTYIVLGVHQPSTTGASQGLGTLPLYTKNPYDIIAGTSNFGPPFVIASFIPEEGIDFPIMSRDWTAGEDPFWAFRKKRRAEQQRVLGLSDGIGMSVVLANEPPDTTPLIPVGKLFEYPGAAWNKLRNLRRLAAGAATLPASGYWGERVPAGTYTTSSCAMLEEIQRHMLEPTIDGGISWSLWTQTEVLQYVNQRIAQFLSATSILTEQTTIAVGGGSANATLPSTVLEVRRVAWNGSGLPRSDSWVQDQGNPGWDQTTGIPYAYVEDGPFSIRLIPTPTIAGTVDLLYVPLPSAVTGTCANLPFPNMLNPYLKYGVMASMFSKQGEANDPQRAQYCEDRFQEGIIMAKLILGLQ